MSEKFKDFFSTQAKSYALYRPNYPPDLFAFLNTVCRAHSLAWDCGTGNGQAALGLVPFFQKVIASDPAQKQISEAPAHPKIEYRLAAAEASRLEAGSVDLVTVAQAFHWFRQKEFFAELTRVARPGCVLAVWCYELAEITPEIDAVVMTLYRAILGPYWDSARKMVEEGYRYCEFPFPELPCPAFRLAVDWNLAEFEGYLGTWSALQKYRTEKHSDPRELVREELGAAWGEANDKKKVQWPLSLRLFRIGSP